MVLGELQLGVPTVLTVLPTTLPTVLPTVLEAPTYTVLLHLPVVADGASVVVEAVAMAATKYELMRKRERNNLF